MSHVDDTPQDAATPAADDAPDPVVATAPQADPPPDEVEEAQAEEREPADEGTILPIPGNRAGTGFA